MLTIIHPRPEPGRVVFLGIEFVDGVAKVPSLHRERKLALTLHGCTVRAVPEPAPVKRGRRK